MFVSLVIIFCFWDRLRVIVFFLLNFVYGFCCVWFCVVFVLDVGNIGMMFWGWVVLDLEWVNLGNLDVCELEKFQKGIIYVG